MGLSSKQVSSDWHQELLHASGKLELSKAPANKMQPAPPQQSEPLKCPRCDSANTKFCYYNNYNKSQPRHFCKACKRHWTKGGTLRNVPIGGGRKNKRLKASNAAVKTTTANAVNESVPIQARKQRLTFPFPLGGEKDVPESTLNGLPSSTSETSLNGNNEVLMDSSLSLSLNHEFEFPYSSLSSFDSNPCSVSSSLQFSNLYSFAGDGNGTEEAAMAASVHTTMSNSSMGDQAWKMTNTSNWVWDDIDKFVSSDLTIPWDDTDLEP
ncbi:hypothetical protein Nepgr_017698 [Nepenthes gracilis]|uniref:Dof zinc finger protein n=1 Tax=Nepenthes gracilis TaxID=150966 RepID=A0AAD3SST3_NEPGR|nr:hypothetical protein Nepgr_017698 [Nepenthes gracilis]